MAGSCHVKNLEPFLCLQGASKGHKTSSSLTGPQLQSFHALRHCWVLVNPTELKVFSPDEWTSRILYRDAARPIWPNDSLTVDSF